ncbi:hypothetical protein BLNAU_24991 [Blattamonas nauphoetae]|uniref:Uncharacterized protein n=1 Tax=Blattamonas nauphoetae TaxID=2049346 RepID=A0ABQ9WKU8_9EUKA|nr:hypothetical protein BLNAU_24991 [Blattamonas nauphoetae]
MFRPSSLHLIVAFFHRLASALSTLLLTITSPTFVGVEIAADDANDRSLSEQENEKKGKIRKEEGCKEGAGSKQTGNIENSQQGQASDTEGPQFGINHCEVQCYRAAVEILEGTGHSCGLFAIVTVNWHAPSDEQPKKSKVPNAKEQAGRQQFPINKSREQKERKTLTNNSQHVISSLSPQTPPTYSARFKLQMLFLPTSFKNMNVLKTILLQCG